MRESGGGVKWPTIAVATVATIATWRPRRRLPEKSKKVGGTADVKRRRIITSRAPVVGGDHDQPNQPVTECPSPLALAPGIAQTHLNNNHLDLCLCFSLL